MIKIRYITSGSYATNCYMLIDEESGECAAADCAVFDAAYSRFLDKLGVKELKYILLTHGHFDHILGVKALKDRCGGKICIHAEDAVCLTDDKESLNYYTDYGVQEYVAPDIILNGGEKLYLGKNEIAVRHTPGHTKGGVCYITDGSMLCGDTLFRLSMGRTDMPGGSTRTLFRTLEEIGRMPGDMDIYPGHGGLTTLQFEKDNNRYLRARKILKTEN